MRQHLRFVLGTFVLTVALATPAAAAVDVDMKKGGVTIKDEKGINSLNIGGRVQFRYTGFDGEELDADNAGSGLGEEDGLSSEFEVKRMRLTFKGGMFRPWLKYKFQFEFTNDGNNVKDAMISFDWSDVAKLDLGQYKTPFSLQELTSSGKQEFVDRAITNKKFAPGRDIGVMYRGHLENKKFGWGAGIFNGGGEGADQDDQGLLYVGRVTFQPLSPYSYSESALKTPEEPQLHFGLGVRTGEAARGTANAAVFEEPDNETAYSFEFAFRQSIFFATAEYFLMSDEVENPVMSEDVESSGWHAQFGVMAVPEKFEIGVRYAMVEPDDDVDDANVSEARLVFGYFMKGHNLKLQADVGQISFEENYGMLSSLALRNLPGLGPRLVSGEELDDTEIRVQVQLAF